MHALSAWWPDVHATGFLLVLGHGWAPGMRARFWLRLPVSPRAGTGSRESTMQSSCSSLPQPPCLAAQCHQAAHHICSLAGVLHTCATACRHLSCRSARSIACPRTTQAHRTGPEPTSSGPDAALRPAAASSGCSWLCMGLSAASATGVPFGPCPLALRACEGAAAGWLPSEASATEACRARASSSSSVTRLGCCTQHPHQQGAPAPWQLRSGAATENFGSKTG